MSNSSALISFFVSFSGHLHKHIPPSNCYIPGTKTTTGERGEKKKKRKTAVTTRNPAHAASSSSFTDALPSPWEANVYLSFNAHYVAIIQPRRLKSSRKKRHHTHTLTSVRRESTCLAGKIHPTRRCCQMPNLPSTEQASISMYYTAAVSKETRRATWLYDDVDLSLSLSVSLSLSLFPRRLSLKLSALTPSLHLSLSKHTSTRWKSGKNAICSKYLNCNLFTKKTSHPFQEKKNKPKTSLLRSLNYTHAFTYFPLTFSELHKSKLFTAIPL